MDTFVLLIIVFFSLLMIFNYRFIFDKNKTKTYEHEEFSIYLDDLDSSVKLPNWLDKNDRIEIKKHRKITHNENYNNDYEDTYKISKYRCSQQHMSAYRDLKKRKKRNG
ncbi:MAG: hypothetical protein ACOCV1_04095 [Bacillota bacterium]